MEGRARIHWIYVYNVIYIYISCDVAMRFLNMQAWSRDIQKIEVEKCIVACSHELQDPKNVMLCISCIVMYMN